MHYLSRNVFFSTVFSGKLTVHSVRSYVHSVRFLQKILILFLGDAKAKAPTFESTSYNEGKVLF